MVDSFRSNKHGSPVGCFKDHGRVFAIRDNRSGHFKMSTVIQEDLKCDLLVPGFDSVFYRFKEKHIHSNYLTISSLPDQG